MRGTCVTKITHRCVLSAGEEVMEEVEVERTAGGGADLLMECDEEEKEGGHDEGEEFKQTC